MFDLSNHTNHRQTLTFSLFTLTINNGGLTTASQNQRAADQAAVFDSSEVTTGGLNTVMEHELCPVDQLLTQSLFWRTSLV